MTPLNVLNVTTKSVQDYQWRKGNEHCSEKLPYRRPARNFETKYRDGTKFRHINCPFEIWNGHFSEEGIDDGELRKRYQEEDIERADKNEERKANANTIIDPDVGQRLGVRPS